jgi:hypothetical protein
MNVNFHTSIFTLIIPFKYCLPTQPLEKAQGELIKSTNTHTFAHTRKDMQAGWAQK